MAIPNVPRIDAKWKVGKKIAVGGFGDIYEVKDRFGRRAVVKTEKGNGNTLAVEDDVLRALSHKPGFPGLFHYGQHHGRHVLVLQRLTMDLRTVKRTMGTRLLWRDVSHVAREMISRLYTLHEAGYVHGDIHPRNIMIGSRSYYNGALIYLIDFGLSRLIRKTKGIDGETKYLGYFVGTVDYSAARVMCNYAPSRVDDLEALGYVLMYLYNHRLPWSKISRGLDRQQGVKDVYNMKVGMRTAHMCTGLPHYFESFMRTVRHLPSSARPPYNFLKTLFQSHHDCNHISTTYDRNGKFDCNW